MSDLITKINNQYIEICEMPEEELAGRVKIRMSALEIVPDNSYYNDNGISWLEEWINENIKSAIGMPYVVSWFDEENQIPSDHGTMSYDEDGYVEFEGVAVGTVLDAYIEDVEIDGEVKKLLMTEGYLYKQRYSKFVDWLKKELKNGKVYGSIEINGKGKNKTIEYLDGATNEDGSRKMGRIPTQFDFSGLAILYLVNPADKSSIVFEVNNKEGEHQNMPNKNIIEINAMNYNDISILVENAFNKKFNENQQSYSWFYVHKFYPTISTFIMRSWDKVGEYYKTTYSIENGTVKIGEIIKVEESWQPVGNDQSIEVNTPIKNIITKYKEVKVVDEKIMLELNQKIEDKVNEINSLNKTLEAKESEINGLNEKVTELNSKVEELNSTIVEVNKSLEDVKKEKEALAVEVNSLKEYKENKETEIKKAEVNAYFETEIPKNGFEEAEINSLKEYVEKCDLEGLKNAEANLIVKRFKEAKKEEKIETNNKQENIFFSTKEEKLDDIEAGKSLFN